MVMITVSSSDPVICIQATGYHTWKGQGQNKILRGNNFTVTILYTFAYEPT